MRRIGRNYREEEEQGPDCSVCAERETCPRYRENSFCTQFHRNKPEPEGTDPNELWKRGEEVEF